MSIDLGDLNWLAVVVAAVAAYVLGAVYYMALAKPWMAAAKLTREQIEGSDNKTAYGLAALASVIGAVVLAILVQATGAAGAVEGLLVGLVVGVIVVGVGQVPNYAFQYRGAKLFVIDAGYPLLQMLLGGAILGAWQ
ncbi:MAG: DUF1761 domain-containing protein [Chloroflexota bacterium]|nr:DUF1761 domain-containing protein [Chloroflexota bacterium]MDE2885049.1 DUF1761 domain-containing protein [Chloroflexota bacterium]